MDFTMDLENAMKNLTDKGGFLSAKSTNGVNCMTVSWGFIGFFWGFPVFIAGIRPQRHTKFVLDKADSFTVSIPYGNLSKELSICGTKSGTDLNKGTIVNYIDAKKVDSPVVAGCNMYYECKIISVDQLNVDLLPDNIIKTFYKNDFHYIYYGEIVDCYKH